MHSWKVDLLLPLKYANQRLCLSLFFFFLELGHLVLHCGFFKISAVIIITKHQSECLQLWAQCPYEWHNTKSHALNASGFDTNMQNNICACILSLRRTTRHWFKPDPRNVQWGTKECVWVEDESIRATTGGRRGQAKVTKSSLMRVAHPQTHTVVFNRQVLVCLAPIKSITREPLRRNVALRDTGSKNQWKVVC